MIRLSPRTSTYAWKWTMPVSAEIVGQELEAIQEEHGELTPDAIVDAARPDSNPLHKLFTWDDTVAGQLHRRNEARLILRNLRIEYTRKEDEGEDEPRVMKVRAFVNVPEAKDEDEEDTPAQPRRVYLSTSIALKNPQQRDYVLKTARAELETWRNRYAAFREFDSVIREIDKTLKTLTTEVKAAA